jgi:protocatechuate 3,4-dioxygenase beta subunit
MLIKVSRRELLLGSVAAMPLLAQDLTVTPLQTIGPFYPGNRPKDQDADLTVIKGKPGRAKGDVLYVMGRVLDPKGKPVRGARIEVWQANAAGRYAHVGDSNPAPLDPNFEGFAVIETDNEGRYKFKTIKPAAYAINKEGRMRPPHIHFDVLGRYSRAITQMYFPNEPLNEKDDIFVHEGGKDRNKLVCKVLPPTKNEEPESKLAMWDIVLISG